MGKFWWQLKAKEREETHWSTVSDACTGSGESTVVEERIVKKRITTTTIDRKITTSEMKLMFFSEFTRWNQQSGIMMKNDIRNITNQRFNRIESS